MGVPDSFLYQRIKYTLLEKQLLQLMPVDGSSWLLPVLEDQIYAVSETAVTAYTCRWESPTPSCTRGPGTHCHCWWMRCRRAAVLRPPPHSGLLKIFTSAIQKLNGQFVHIYPCYTKTLPKHSFTIFTPAIQKLHLRAICPYLSLLYKNLT